MKKYIISVLFLAFVIAPALSYGATIDAVALAQLRAQIAVLQRQINLLQSQTVSKCPLNKDLTYGAGNNDGLNADVVLLQNWLRASGYLNISQSTGRFGTLTRSAIRNWQKDNNLSTTGNIGIEERLILCGAVDSNATTTVFRIAQ